jgi:hypothetical protein
MLRNDPWASIRDAGLRLATDLHAMVDGIDHLFVEAARFGQLGWPINPMWETVELVGLVEALGQAGCDEVFVGFYEAEHGARIQEALRGLGESQRMARWRAIMLQSRDAIERDHHALVVPALLTVLEGLVFPDQTKNTRVMERVEQLAKEQAVGGYLQLVWQTIDDYVKALYAHSDFQAGEPHFNRHWILHGRSSSTWTRTDSIRLLHGIHTIHASLYEAE